MSYFYIYKMTHPETGEFYIGRRTSKVPSNEDAYTGSSKTWYNTLDKHTIKKVLIKTIILDNVEDFENLCKKELEIILENIQNPLCRNAYIPNIGFYRKGPLTQEHKNKISSSSKGIPRKPDPDGQRWKTRRLNGNDRHTEESKSKMSSSHTGYVHTKESKEKISQNSYWKTEEGRKEMSIMQSGKEKNENWKTNISKSLIGRKFTEETKLKMSNAGKGKKLSEETKLKMSNAKKNISEETRKKLSDAAKNRKN